MQERMDEMKDDTKANRKADRENVKEMREGIKSGQAEIRFIVNAWIADMKMDRKGTITCHLIMAACMDSKELNPEWNIGRSLRKRPQ
jgi:hypothetical protein